MKQTFLYQFNQSITNMTRIFHAFCMFSKLWVFWPRFQLAIPYGKYQIKAVKFQNAKDRYCLFFEFSKIDKCNCNWIRVFYALVVVDHTVWFTTDRYLWTTSMNHLVYPFLLVWNWNWIWNQGQSMTISSLFREYAKVEFEQSEHFEWFWVANILD